MNFAPRLPAVFVAGSFGQLVERCLRNPALFAGSAWLGGILFLSIFIFHINC